MKSCIQKLTDIIIPTHSSCLRNLYILIQAIGRTANGIAFGLDVRVLEVIGGDGSTNSEPARWGLHLDLNVAAWEIVVCIRSCTDVYVCTYVSACRHGGSAVGQWNTGPLRQWVSGTLAHCPRLNSRHAQPELCMPSCDWPAAHHFAPYGDDADINTIVGVSRVGWSIWAALYTPPSGGEVMILIQCCTSDTDLRQHWIR